MVLLFPRTLDHSLISQSLVLQDGEKTAPEDDQIDRYSVVAAKDHQSDDGNYVARSSPQIIPSPFYTLMPPSDRGFSSRSLSVVYFCQSKLILAFTCKCIKIKILGTEFHLQLYHPPETLSALMTINYPVVLLLVYREGGYRWAHRRHLFHPFFVRLFLESVGPASASIWGIHPSRVEGDVSVSLPLYSAPL